MPPGTQRSTYAGVGRVSRRNATFQQWAALLDSRQKRHRRGELLVQGVRPISLAVEHGLEVRALLYDGRARASAWAGDLLGSGLAPVVEVAPDLMAELGQRDDGPPEMVAVVGLPADDLARIPDVPNPLVVVFDRPTSPGNIGSLARSVDALGGTALVVTGHAADPWDPQAVRASTGSVFSVPVVRLDSPAPLLAWRAERSGIALLGTDEHGDLELPEAPLAGPAVVVVGNETRGMSAAWRAACDQVVRIPMTGSASSLNAAVSGSLVLYEALRQRR